MLFAVMCYIMLSSGVNILRHFNSTFTVVSSKYKLDDLNVISIESYLLTLVCMGVSELTELSYSYRVAHGIDIGAC